MYGKKLVSAEPVTENIEKKSISNEELSSRAATIADPLNVLPRQKYNISSSLLSVHAPSTKSHIPLTSLSVKNQINSANTPPVEIHKPSMIEHVQNLSEFYSQRTRKVLDKMCEIGARELHLSHCKTNHKISQSDKENKENEKGYNQAQHKVEMRQQIPNVKTFPRSSPIPSYYHNNNHNHSMYTQNVFADAINPSVVGATNIRFVTTDEREQRDRQVTQALNIISQSMEPPIHTVDGLRDWILEYFRPDDDADENSWQVFFYKILTWFMDTPLTFMRAVWNYVFMEIHLAYNLVLLYATFVSTPPIIFFVVGLTLFWVKVLYEIYRDIMHRDDPVYASQVPKEMSIAAAISASMGFVLNMKAKNGEITKAWWNGESK